MSNSWRINTLFDNRSQRVLPSPGTGLGATVVRSSRGLKEPVYFGQGETRKMLNLFGSPSPSNPELLEAIEYNKSYPMYLVSPMHFGKHGGVFIGSEGTVSLADEAGLTGVADEENKSFSFFELFGSLTKTEDATYAGVIPFTDKLVLDESDVAEMIELHVEGESQNVSYTEDTGTYSFTGDSIESGTLTVDTGEIEITFSEGGIPESGDVVEVKYAIDVSNDYYAFLMAKGASDETYLRVKNTEVDIQGSSAFEMEVQQRNLKHQFVDANFSPITFSLNSEHENGFGINIFAENIFDGSEYFKPFVNEDITYSSFADDESYVEVGSGYRGGELTDMDFTEGYEPFKQTRKYPIDIFFDASQNEGVPTAFSDLRSNHHKYSRYLLPVPDMSIEEAIAWSLPAEDRGISYNYGYFMLRNPYHSSSKLKSIPMGEVAVKHADTMLLGFGGIAPAWFDENGMGGQLTGGRVVEAIYDPTEDQLKQLDEARINPIVNDPSYGVMIVSRRTSEPGSLSDWSFIDYVGAMDYIIKNVSKQVLPFQIVKLNDSIHRNIVRTKIRSIVEPMTVAPLNVVDSYAVKCDSENNNADVRAREEFRADLAVKFTAKSRTIYFTFINTPQGSEVEEMFE